MELISGYLAVTAIFSILQVLLSTYEKSAESFFAKKNKKSNYSEIEQRLQEELTQLKDSTATGLLAYKDSINKLIINMYIANIIYVIFCFILLIMTYYLDKNSYGINYLIPAFGIILFILIIIFIGRILLAEFSLRSVWNNDYKTALTNSKKKNNASETDLK